MGGHRKECEDALIGTFCTEVAVTTPDGPVFFGNAVFQPGGFLIGADTADIGQPFLNPDGQFLTPWTGNWKKVSHRKYKFFFTNVINNPALPGVPFKRFRVDGDLILSENKQTFVANVLANLYDINDITLSTPTFAAPATITGHRANFM